MGSSDAAALAVAQHILGVGPSVKYASGATSVLGKAVAASGGVGMATAININYSDTGLFGYFVVADSASADKVSWVNIMKDLGICQNETCYYCKAVTC